MASIVANPAAITDASELVQFRDKVAHVSRQSMVFFLGTVFTTLSGYLFKVYLARTLGAESLGIYTLGMTLVGLLGLFAAFGLPQAITRFVAISVAQSDHRSLAQILARSLMLLLIGNLIIGGLILCFGPRIATRLYHSPILANCTWMFALLMVLGALNCFLGQALGGHGEVARRTVITNFVGSPVVMLVSILCITQGLGLRGYIAAQLLGALLVLGLLGRSVLRLLPDIRQLLIWPLPKLPAPMVSFSAAVFVIQGLEYVLAQGDKIILGIYLDPRHVGVYSVATAIVVFVPIILQSVNQIFSPVIADLYTHQNHALLLRLYQSLTKWVTGLTIPLAMVLFIFAGPLMRVFGTEFESGWLILVIGTAGQLINCGVGSVGFLLLMSGNQRRLLRIEAVMAVSTISLDLYLIPRCGLVGAAIAGAIITALTNCWALYEVRRLLGLWPYNRTYWTLLAPSAATIAAVVAWRTLRHPNASVGAIFVGLLLAYSVFIAAALFPGMGDDDKVIAKTLWRHLRNFVGGAEA